MVQNQEGKTPGVDKIIWKTPQQKMQAAQSLTRRGYKTQPLRRIYIPKKDGRLRPLSIPTMKCRAMQALHLLALEPIAEFKADKNSYGFRPKRSAADALGACHIDKGVFHQTELGTPQGGLASPTLLVLTLSGLEDTVLKAISKRKDKVHFSIYADDFIITSASKEVLEVKVKPLVESFLHQRGLAFTRENQDHAY